MAEQRELAFMVPDADGISAAWLDVMWEEFGAQGGDTGPAIMIKCRWCPNLIEFDCGEVLCTDCRAR